MLTIDADDHALMRNFHKPGDEKRMVMILPEAAYDDWLDAPAARSNGLHASIPGGAIGGQYLKGDRATGSGNAWAGGEQ